MFLSLTPEEIAAAKAKADILEAEKIAADKLAAAEKLKADAIDKANKAYNDFLKSLFKINEEYRLKVVLHNTEKGQLDALLVKNKAIFDAYKNHYANGGYTQDEIVRLEVMLNNIRLVEEEVARYNELLIEQKKQQRKSVI